MKAAGGEKDEVGVIIVGDERGSSDDNAPSAEGSGEDVEAAVDGMGTPEEAGADKDDSPPTGEERVAGRPPPRSRKGGLRRRIGLWLACYSLVALLYIGFFSYPVQPAHLNGFNYTVSVKVYQTLPYTYEVDYISISDRSAVVVLTVRTIQVPDKAYSTALRNAEGITESYLRDQYGIDVDVRFFGESHTTVEGHDAVRQDYDVYKTGPLGAHTLPVAKMSVLAWFCNVDFVSVAAGFFHSADSNPDITGNLQCH